MPLGDHDEVVSAHGQPHNLVVQREPVGGRPGIGKEWLREVNLLLVKRRQRAVGKSHQSVTAVGVVGIVCRSQIRIVKPRRVLGVRHDLGQV